MRTNAAMLMVGLLVITGGIGSIKAQSFTDPVFKPMANTVDFGEVDSKNDPGFRMLIFTNEGNAPLTITNAVGSCGCTVADWPKEPIKPGKTAEIRITYKLTNLGMINKTVTITTNEPDGKDADGNMMFKKHTIQVKGNVK
jgi:hypothetical protein